MPAQVIPVQWPIQAITRTAILTAANTPVLLMPYNKKRAYFALSNDQVTFTIAAGGTITYTRFDPLYFSLGPPMSGGTNGTGFVGGYLAPGVFEPSLFGGVTQQEIWVWSPLAAGAPWTIAGFEGVNDPSFDPNKGFPV